MRADLQARLLKVAKDLERLDRIRGIVEDINQTNPRGLVASAAIAGAEFIAASTGHIEDPGVIHRAYEEIFAALEHSPAINEMLAGRKLANKEVKCATANSTLRQFRMRLLSLEGNDE